AGKIQPVTATTSPTSTTTPSVVESPVPSSTPTMANFVPINLHDSNEMAHFVSLIQIQPRLQLIQCYPSMRDTLKEAIGVFVQDWMNRFIGTNFNDLMVTTLTLIKKD